MKRTELTIKSNTNNCCFRHSTIKPAPEIEIWYAPIPDLMDYVFSEKKYCSSNFKVQRSIFFKKSDLTANFFSEEELDTINGFKAFKKQIEWMAGRCLIKHMVLKYSDREKIHSVTYIKNRTKKNQKIKLDHIIISHHDQGAPFLEKWPLLKISISHSGKYAAAAICVIKEKEIGLDIEKIGKMPDASFMKLAFTEKEIASLKHYPQNTPQCHEEIFKKWTLKEAFLKFIKKGFNESLHRVEILDNQIFHNNRKQAVSIFSTIIGNDIKERYSLSMISQHPHLRP